MQKERKEKSEKRGKVNKLRKRMKLPTMKKETKKWQKENGWMKIIKIRKQERRNKKQRIKEKNGYAIKEMNE